MLDPARLRRDLATRPISSSCARVRYGRRPACTRLGGITRANVLARLRRERHRRAREEFQPDRSSMAPTRHSSPGTFAGVAPVVEIDGRLISSCARAGGRAPAEPVSRTDCTRRRRAQAAATDFVASDDNERRADHAGDDRFESASAIAHRDVVRVQRNISTAMMRAFENRERLCGRRRARSTRTISRIPDSDHPGQGCRRSRPARPRTGTSRRRRAHRRRTGAVAPCSIRST